MNLRSLITKINQLEHVEDRVSESSLEELQQEFDFVYYPKKHLLIVYPKGSNNTDASDIYDNSIAWIGLDYAGIGPNGEEQWSSSDTMVQPKYRRRGLATAMYRYIRRQGINLVSSNEHTKQGAEMWKSFRNKGLASGDKFIVSSIKETKMDFKKLIAKIDHINSKVMLTETSAKSVKETSSVTDYSPKSQGGTRKELLAKYAKTKSSKDAAAARRAGATQKELASALEKSKSTDASSGKSLTELSKGTLSSYISKAKDKSSEEFKDDKDIKKLAKRSANISNAKYKVAIKTPPKIKVKESTNIAKQLIESFGLTEAESPWAADPVKDAAWKALSPEDQTWLGGADPTDQYILARAPNKGKPAAPAPEANPYASANVTPDVAAGMKAANEPANPYASANVTPDVAAGMRAANTPAAAPVKPAAAPVKPAVAGSARPAAQTSGQPSIDPAKVKRFKELLAKMNAAAA